MVISEGLGDCELLIVSHGNTLKCWGATVIDEDWRCVEGVHKLGNCEIIEYDLDLEGSDVKFPEELTEPVFLHPKN